MTDSTRTAALKIPILPHTSPAAPQPPLKTPLYDHQLRALHRCMLIEKDGSLSSDFGAQHDYSSRGGCLADAVGMGKTATMIGLIASDRPRKGEGDTLVVAPGHLIHQWKSEIEKFSDDIEVLVGNNEYASRAKFSTKKSHRVVLVDVNQILNEKRVWYDFKRIFSGPKGNLLLYVLIQRGLRRIGRLHCFVLNLLEGPVLTLGGFTRVVYIYLFGHGGELYTMKFKVR